MRARQMTALVSVTVLGFGAAFSIGRAGDDGRDGGRADAPRAVASGLRPAVAAGTVPLPQDVPDLAPGHEAATPGRGTPTWAPQTPAAPARPAAATTAPTPSPAAAAPAQPRPQQSAAGPQTGTAPQPAPHPQAATPAEPAPQGPTVTTIIGGG